LYYNLIKGCKYATVTKRNNMKNLSLLLISILLLSGCWKDVAGDIVVGGFGAILNNYSDKTKKEECKVYKASFNWENNLKGKTTDMIIKKNILYSIKELRYGNFQVSEINTQNGTLLNTINFSTKNIDEENSSSGSSIDDLVFFKDDSEYSILVAYDIKNHSVIWLKKGNVLNKNEVSGYFYYSSYNYSGGKKSYSINSINALTGEEKLIYTFPNLINNRKLKEIKHLNAFSDFSGSLHFAYVAITKNEGEDKYVTFRLFDSFTKTTKDFAEYSTNNYNYLNNVISFDDEKIYICIDNDIYGYNKFTGEKVWSNYSPSNRIYSNSYFKIIGDYLVVNQIKTIKVIDKHSGDLIYANSSYYGSKTFEMFENNLMFTNSNYFFKLDEKGKIKNQFISKAYCETSNSRNTIKFKVTDSGSVIISDNKYISNLILNK